MKILLVDTCGITGTVALANTDATPPIIASSSLPGRTASERLVPTIKDLAVRGSIPLNSLAAIAVVHGPGSFTGVRVGLSAAKGLCHALNLPLIAISRLAVLAHLADAPPGLHIHALLDAGRGDFYSGLYADGICFREALQTRDEFLVTSQPNPGAGSPIIVACETSVAAAIAALNPKLVAEPSATDAFPLALARLQQRTFDDPATIDANYLRRTDAEIFAKPTPPAVAAAQPGTPSR
jgi:tRNA threonylcarbamoyladenosine biosynthesis protein TsaB